MLGNNRMKYVNTRIWETKETFIFPEQQTDHPDFIGSKGNVGICFSGGGTRSATCTHGQLKALVHTGLLDHVGYISCVSGGAWAALPFTFLNKYWEDSHFFGNILEAGELTEDVLTSINKQNYLYTVTHAGILDHALKNWLNLATDETYSRAIGKVFLDHFNLNSRKKLFANSSNQVKDILERNNKLSANDFYTVRPHRPFLITTGALLRPGLHDYVFEMTPWYSGIYAFYPKGKTNSTDIGGGYIESFACDSGSPDTITEQTANVRIGSKKHRFTLSDVLGTTGAAPSEVLHNIGLKDIGFPEFKHWSARNGKKAKEYEIGDGGNIENLGILPLIQRDVKKIIVFVNTKKPLSVDNPSQINRAIKKLFKPGDVNHIFPKNQLQNLQNGLLERLSEGKATIYKDLYTVLKNKHHSIKGGNTVEVLWVYNHNYLNWQKKLPEEIFKKYGKRKLSNFPHFRTFLQNAPRFIDLDPIQANLLSHMSCSVVRDNLETFTEFIT